MESKKSLQVSQPFNQTAWLIGIGAWLLPGAGHFAQKRYGRGTVLSSIVIAMFVTGLLLQGNLTIPFESDPTGSFFLQLLKSFANIGNGIIYAVCIFAGIGTNIEPKMAEAYTFEYGNTFTLVSGLLNYLIALDAFDIYVGRKE